MESDSFYEVPQGDAPTYDDLVTEEDRDKARAIELLRSNSTPERVAALAESIAEQRREFEKRNPGSN